MTRVVYTNAHIWDGISDDIDAGRDALVVEDGRIVAHCSSEEVAGESSRDLGGAWLTPGLIDAHIHLCLNPEIRDPLEHGRLPREQQLAEMRERAGQMLSAGITTARDLGGGQWLELEIRDEVRAGTTRGSRLVCAGQPITSVGGHCHFWGGEADSVATALEVLQRQDAHGVDLIKVMATGGNITPGSKPIDSQFDTATLRSIVDAAGKLGYTVAAHCHGTQGIDEAASAGVTTIEHCSWVSQEGWGKGISDEIIGRIVAAGAWVSPTINSGWQRFRKNEAFTAMIQANYERMKAQGVRLIASTDAGIPNVYHHDLPAAVPQFAFFAGLSPVEALRTATSECARAVGIDSDVGQLATGRFADFLLFNDSPLEDVARIATPAAVYQSGTQVT